MMKKLFSHLDQDPAFQDFILIDEKNRTLFSITEGLHQDLYLASCAEALLQFIRPLRGEVFLTNDLISGSFQNGHICFLFLVHETLNGKIYGLSRKTFIPLGKIPPVPIVQNSKISDELFEAIFSKHEDKKYIQTYIENHIQEISSFVQRLNSYLLQTDFLSHREKFFLDEKEKIKSIFSENPSGASSTLGTLEKNIQARVKLNIDEHMIHFDFSGSSESPNYGLPSSMTSSLAFGLLANIYRLPQPFHHAHFSFLQTSASPRSILSSQIKSYEQWLTHSSEKRLTEIIHQAFGKIHHKTLNKPPCNVLEKLFLVQNGEYFEVTWIKSRTMQPFLSLKMNNKSVQPYLIFEHIQNLEFDHAGSISLLDHPENRIISYTRGIQSEKNLGKNSFILEV